MRKTRQWYFLFLCFFFPHPESENEAVKCVYALAFFNIFFLLQTYFIFIKNNPYKLFED